VSQRIIALAGVALIVLGVIGLVYGGFHYTTREQVVKIGPIEATAEKEKSVPISPLVSAVVLAAGVVLVFTGGRRKA